MSSYRQCAKALSFGFPGGLSPRPIMKHNRKWDNQHNASGFVAACARLAFSFYDGPRRHALEGAIECAERYANGAVIDRDEVTRLADGAMWVSKVVKNHAAGLYNFYAARTAAASARFVGHSRRSDVMRTIIRYATEVGVDAHDIDVAYARWTVRDLSPQWPIDETLRLAAGAAVVAGDEALAKDLLAVVVAEDEA